MNGTDGCVNAVLLPDNSLICCCNLCHSLLHAEIFCWEVKPNNRIDIHFHKVHEFPTRKGSFNITAGVSKMHLSCAQVASKSDNQPVHITAFEAKLSAFRTHSISKSYFWFRWIHWLNIALHICNWYFPTVRDNNLK